MRPALRGRESLEQRDRAVEQEPSADEHDEHRERQLRPNERRKPERDGKRASHEQNPPVVGEQRLEVVNAIEQRGRWRHRFAAQSDGFHTARVTTARNANTPMKIVMIVIA